MGFETTLGRFQGDRAGGLGWIGCLGWVLLVGCTAGGQSFDDGRDGVEARPSDGMDAVQGDGTDAAPNETTDDGRVEQTDTDQADTEQADTDQAVVSDPDEEPSTDDTEDPDLDETHTDAPEDQRLRSVADSTACLLRDGDGLRVEVTHECLCPGMLRCSVAVDGDSVQLEAWVEELDEPCPPACFADAVSCSAAFDSDTGNLVYADEELPFALDELQTQPGGSTTCLTVTTESQPSGEPAAELCKRLETLEPGQSDGPLDVDLTSGVELTVSQTAIDCDCCNWSWGWYVIECENTGATIVLTTDDAPYGTAVAEPAPGMDDSFGSEVVTLGCMGPECEPVCVPEQASGLAVATGELRLLDEGFVSMAGEDLLAEAEFRISTAR